MSLRVPLIGSFLSAALSLGHCHSFYHNTFFIYIDKLVYTKFLRLDHLQLGVAEPAFPQTAVSATTPLTVLSDFIFSISLSFFAALSSLSVSSLFWLFIFTKCHVDFIPGRQHNTILLSACELNNRCAITNHWPWKKWCSHWSCCTSLIYIVICGLKLVAKRVLYAVTHS